MNIEISGQAFHQAWQHFKLGPKPLALNILPDGITESERREAEARGQDELRRLGFGDRDREDDISGVFVPLHRYRRAFDVVHRYTEDDREHRVSGMAALGPGSVSLAVHDGDNVRLTLVRAEELHHAIVGVLPNMQAGPGRSVSLRSSQLDTAASEAGGSDRAMQDNLVQQGVRRDDARSLVEMVGGDRVGYAQFGASVMDRRGNRTRAPMVTNCFATANGWYLMEETRRTGEAWTTFAPVDRPRMAERVHGLTRTVVAD